MRLAHQIQRRQKEIKELVKNAVNKSGLKERRNEHKDLNLYFEEPESIMQTKPKEILDYVGPKAKCAVFGAGLSKSGAFAIKNLIMEPTAPATLLKATRITRLNEFRIKQLAAGLGFSLFSTTSILLGSGLNNFYQLGGPMKKNNKSQAGEYFIIPHRILLPNSPKIISISAGRLHSLIGTAEGIYSLGDNQHGQGGQDPEKYKNVAHFGNGDLMKVELPGDSPCKQVHCSLDSSFVLLENGDLYAFGLGTDGQLGTGCMDIDWVPKRVRIDEPIKMISGSGDTLVAVTKTGKLFIWGQVEYGQFAEFSHEPQLFIPQHARFDFNNSEVNSAATTTTSCIVSTKDGEVFTWGSLFLGSGPTVRETSRPIQLSPNLFADSRGRFGKVRQVRAGICTVAAINEADNLFMWGANRHGSLAVGHDKDQFFPYQVFLPNSVRKVVLGPIHSLIMTDPN